MNKKIVILFSGAGKNLEAILEKLHNKPQPNCSIEVVAAITNRPDAQGIKIAEAYNIPAIILDHTLFESREAYDTKLVSIIQEYTPDLVVMAGFMRIVTDIFTTQVKAINIHPSLLPKHKGARAIEQSFESGDRECGVSVHHVSSELDGGEIILQQSFSREEDMRFEDFLAQIKSIEHEIFSQAILKLLCG